MIFGFDFQRDEVSFSFLLSHPTALSCISEVAADIECRAGESGRNHGKRHRTGDESRSNFLLQRHNRIDPSLVDCRHFVGGCYNTPILMKMQVFSRNFSIYSFLYGIYSYRVFHLPLRERKKPPRLPLSETGAVHLRYLCLFKVSHNYLRGFLIAAWAGVKITERSE